MSLVPFKAPWCASGALCRRVVSCGDWFRIRAMDRRSLRPGGFTGTRMGCVEPLYLSVRRDQAGSLRQLAEEVLGAGTARETRRPAGEPGSAGGAPRLQMGR